MRRLFPLILAIIHALFALPATAQDTALEYEGQVWRVAAQEAEVTNYLGREAIKLMRGRLWADDMVFTDGVISFDAAYAEQQIFIGASWRAASDRHYEEMYFRGHLNEKPDALQYTPVENGNSAWQIFSDGNGIAPVSQKYDGWNKVKIVVQGDRADIYFNSDAPVIHIPDLKTALTSGYVGLRSSGQQAGPAYFSNITIRPLQAGDAIVGTPKPSAELPEGLIGKWNVSSTFAETLVDSSLTLSEKPYADLTWQTLPAETNGIANISRVAERNREANTVFVRLSIVSETDQMKELSFGYSDRVRIYLNGKRIYYGNAGWRVRDYRFLGTVGFFDSAGLDLRKGKNELTVAISETFGGWAWAGAIADRSGITVGD